ncbi:MAG: hypothetical protein CMJ78_19225 [Planctomycetaceae bacterium]|nr:hypothetical protein [Planctomycetaceae bacterium]
MNRKHFLNQRRVVWKRFEHLVQRITKVGKSRLRGAELAEFSRLFRELSNDLATIRSRAWGQQLVSYLNDLVGRGHNGFYSAPPSNISTKLMRFFTIGFPQLVRANSKFMLTAWLLFFVPLGITWATIQWQPLLAYRVVPAEQLDMMEQMYRSRDDANVIDAEDTDSDRRENDSEEQGEPSFFGFGEERSAMAGYYIEHNTGIALRAFALGILLGVGTVYVLLYNGIVIGAVAGWIISAGHGDRFLTFIVSHGSFELTAIAIAGGAGMMLGDALIHPNQRSPIQSLMSRGLDAVKIMCGAAVMLFIAALIEAYWSPSGVPATAKFAVGGMLWLLVYAYFGFAGLRVATND